MTKDTPPIRSDTTICASNSCSFFLNTAIISQCLLQPTVHIRVLASRSAAEEGMKFANRSTMLFISLNLDYVHYRAILRSNQHYTRFRMFNCLTSDIHTTSLRCCDKACVQCRLNSNTEFRNMLIGWREGQPSYAYIYVIPDISGTVFLSSTLYISRRNYWPNFACCIYCVATD